LTLVLQCEVFGKMNKFYLRKHGDSPAKTHLENAAAALGVALTQKAGHVLLIYPDYGDDGESKQLNQLHFLANKIEVGKISLEAAEKGHFFYAVAACVDDFNLVNFNAYLMAVARNEVELRYGVDWDDYEGLFDDEGQFQPEAHSAGLTCASFLSEVFYGFSIKLFAMKSWPSNDKLDVLWRDTTFSRRLELARGGQGRLSVEQIQAILEVSPLVRLHPTEVAAVIASREFGSMIRPARWPNN
jgi:hypothetical protein